MQIDLSEHTAALALQQAELSGYGNDIAAYVAHLVQKNDVPPRGVPSPRTKEELNALLEEGLASGVADRSWDEMMQALRDQLTARMNAEQS